MKKSLFCFLYLCFCWCTVNVFADAPIEDGVYSISCKSGEGFVALGAYHDMSPYICYVTDGSALTEDAYWVVTNTKSGVTFRNEASGQFIIFTTGRDDAYYKGMTIADAAPDDQSHLWNVTKNEDGSVSINSALYDYSSYYWNLRYSQGLLGTYNKSWGGSDNEHYFFTKKGSNPDPGPDTPDNPDTPDTPTTSRTSFPNAFHVFLTDGRLEAYPLSIVKSHSEAGGKLVIETTIGKTYSYNLTDVASTSETAPTDFPTFESFKFNNKFNDQLFTDADGEMKGDTVYVTIAAIGKRLTPSFKLPDGKEIEVYVDNVKQESKVTRLRFDKDIYYVVTHPGYQMLLPEASGNQKGSETYSMQPYGRIVRVHVNWLTDQAKVPAIYINTDDGLAITSKDYYKDATIYIDGQGVFPSMETTYVQIKGRGNSSWGWSKKPYRLKFEEKVKPLGMTKGKSWVLLANGIGGSMMTNAIGMKAANLMGAAAANHIVPVDLYLNGEYRGSYNLTEKVGLSNNSVDLEDETAAALLELDSYYDEPDGQKFRTTPYNLPINVKAPDFTEDETRLTLEIVQKSFNDFVKTLYQGRDITKHVDLEQLVRFLMVDELTLNYEFYHPKSTFCYRESFESDTSKYVFGPVWDLDWCFGYEHNGNYFTREATANYWKDETRMEVIQFVRDLRFKYAPLGELYEKLWKEFMDNDLEELMEYCQDYYDFAHNSFDSNRSVWGDWTDYEQQAKNAASWLETRTQKIYEDIINDVRPDMPEPVIAINFDNDKLYTLTCKRGALVLSADHTKLQAGQSRTDAPEEDYKFAIIHIGDYNYLYSPVLKKFMTTISDSEDGRFTDEGLGSVIGFDISHADGEYVYMITADGSKWFNNNGTTIVINSWNKPDDGDRWLIEEAGDFDPTEALALADKYLIAVTNNIIFNGKVIATETVKLPSGAEVPTPSTSYINDFVALNAPSNVPQFVEDKDITVNYTAIWGGPFEFSQTEENAKWYNMTIRSSYYVGKDVTEPYYPIEYDEDALASHDYQWAFAGDPYHVKVYNRSTGFTQSLTAVNNDAVMRDGDYAWDLLPRADGFLLRKPGTEYLCLNQIGGKDGPLQFWDSKNSLNDNGSTFRVEEVIDIVEPSAIIIANNYSRVYGDDNPDFNYTTQGGAVEGIPEIVCAADKKSAIGTYPISITRGSITNKDVTFVNGTLTITPAPLTIKAETYTKKQGEQNPDFKLTYEGFKNGETEKVLTKKPSITTAATVSSKPGDYLVTLSGAKADNYTISYVNGTLVVIDADALVVVAKSYSREYGDPNPTFEYTTDGATMVGKPNISCSATIKSSVGTYDIVVSKGSVQNYNDSYVNGKLTITQAPLKITANDLTIEQGEEVPELTLTYEGFKNGETEKVLKKKPTVTTNATSESLAGSYQILVSGGDATNYAITRVNGTLTIKIPAVVDAARDMQPNSDDIYDLAGRKLNRLPRRGVFITKGTKMLVK